MESKKNKSFHIPTSTLEQDLKEKALKTGIHILYESVEDIEKLKTKPPSVKVIIGSNGAKSQARKQFFNDELQADHLLEYSVLLKYRTRETRAQIGSMKTFYLQKRINAFANEHVGRTVQDTTASSTLQIFLSEAQFQAIASHTFKKGTQIKHLMKGTPLKKEVALKLLAWIENKKLITKSQMVEGSDQVTAASLRAYSVKSFTGLHVDKTNRKVHYALIGDRPIGLPFFRGLNAGFIALSHLARALASKDDLLEENLGKYQIKAQRLASNEIFQARAKKLFYRHIQASH